VPRPRKSLDLLGNHRLYDEFLLDVGMDQ
jgi:hypothetical protein